MKKCPICAHDKLDELNQYIDSDNYSYDEIKRIFLAEFNLDVKNYQIRVHKRVHKNQESTIINNSKIDRIALADFDKFLADYELTREDLMNLNNIEKLLGASQKMLMKSYFLNMCLLQARLESAIERKAPYPREEIGGLEKIYGMLEKNAGLKIRIDGNEAFKVIESMGYRVVED